MSSKITIALTHDNEHFYEDCCDYVYNKDDVPMNKITLEFDPKNINVVCNDEEDLIIEITNPDSDLYKIFKSLRHFGYDWLKENDLI